MCLFKHPGAASQSNPKNENARRQPGAAEEVERAEGFDFALVGTEGARVTAFHVAVSRYGATQQVMTGRSLLRPIGGGDHG